MKKGIEIFFSYAPEKEALEAYDQAIRLDPNPQFYQSKGEALVGQKEYEQALEAYNQAIRLSPSGPNPQLYQSKGEVYERLAQQAYELAQETWANKLTMLHKLTGHSDRVQSVALSPDGRTLASGSGDKTIKVWDMQTGQLLRELKGHSGVVLSIAISPDG